MEPTLFQLLPELLHMVFSMLPVVSQGCLALTCKTYYTQFKSVFRGPFFNLEGPGMDWLAFEEMNTDTASSLGTRIGEDRVLSLTQVQTPELRYCASCCVLHSYIEFDEEGLGKLKRLKSCKWPGIALTGRRQEPYVTVGAYLANLDRKLPWSYEYERPDSGYMELTLERDENYSIISTSVYLFAHIHDNFVVNMMACPHIALEDLLITLDTEYLKQKFDCLHCGARMKTRMTLSRYRSGHG